MSKLYRSYTVTQCWNLKKAQRFNILTPDKVPQLVRIESVVVSQTFSAFEGANHTDVSMNVHMSGRPLDEDGKKIKGKVAQVNTERTDMLPDWIKDNIDALWRVRNILHIQVRSPFIPV